MRRKIKVLTVGCKANFADSASIVRTAVAAGYEVVSPAEPADVVVVNSCTVTHRADRDSRALVRRARRDHPSATVVMAGCYARVSPGARDDVPEADHWVGEDGPDALRDLLARIDAGGPDSDAEPSDYVAGLLLGHRRTFLKIQDGCDASCAYCVVPRARGKSRSVPKSDILARAAAAEADGARELVLTGIHVGLYGADRGEPDALASLLAGLLRETSRARIRLSSVEPMELTDRLLDVVAQEPRICPHLHVPLQSGSDKTLSRMRRPYRSREYREVVRRAASRIADLQLGADVIVGFPGETGDDFEETVRLLGEVPAGYLHVFPYSARAGTESSRWKDDVPAAEKKERVARLREMDGRMREAFLRAQIGKTMSVLPDTILPGRGELSGLSGNYLDVVFPGDADEVGETVRVRADAVREGRLHGVREGRDVRS